MKVLFAVGSDQISKNIADRYYEKYGEVIEYKTVFYFKNLLDAVKEDKTYDIIVINEENMEQYRAKDIDQIDAEIFGYVDAVTDEVQDAEIIFIGAERRSREDKFILRLYHIGIYNILLGDNRSVNSLCEVIKKPKTKREAKEYLRIDATKDISDTGMISADEVDEAQMMNILNYYDKHKHEPEKYVEIFDQIAGQYSRAQLKVILSWLPQNVQNEILKENRYSYLLSNEQPVLGTEKESIKNMKKIEKKSSNKSFFGRFKKDKSEDEGPISKMDSKHSNVNPVEVGVHLTEQAKQYAEAKAKKEKEDEERRQKELSQKAWEDAQNRASRPKPVIEVEESTPSLESSLNNALNQNLQRQSTPVGNPEQDVRAQQAALEAQAKKEQELRAQQAALEAQAKKEQELKAQQALEAQAKKEQELKAQQALEAQAKREQELKVQQALEAQAKKEQELKAQQALEAQAKREQELKAQQALEAQAKREQELKAQQALEAKQREEALNQKLNEGFTINPMNMVPPPVVETPSSRANPVTTGNINETESVLDVRTRPEQRDAVDEREMLAKEQEKVRQVQAALEEERRKLREEQERIENERNQLNSLQQQQFQQIQQTPRTYESTAVAVQDFKKIVAFVGANKVGTSFLVNALANELSGRRLVTGILDMTKEKGMYFIYNQNDKTLRRIALDCMKKLSEGEDSFLPMTKYLKVYTTVPSGLSDSRRGYKHKTIIDTVKENNNITLIDADFSTPIDYFQQASEIYLVHDMDILNIQETTTFLREMKDRQLDMNKIKVVVNKYVKNVLTPKKIVDGLSYYKDPEMTYTDTLFTGRVEIFEIPYNLNNYVKYTESLYKGTMDFKGYSADFSEAINHLANQVYRQAAPAKKSRGLFG